MTVIQWKHRYGVFLNARLMRWMITIWLQIVPSTTSHLFWTMMEFCVLCFLFLGVSFLGFRDCHVIIIGPMLY